MTSQQRSMFDDPLEKARELKVRGRLDDAEKVLRQALSSQPDNLKIKASLADVCYRLDKHREAMSLAGAILSVEPDDPRALVVMGNTLLAKSKPREALEYFQLAQEVAPTDYLFTRIARCHLDSKQPQLALQAIERAEAIRPQTGPKLQYLRAKAARMLGDASMEKQALDQTADSAPVDEEGFFKHVWPLLDDLPPRRAAMVAARMRETPGQEHNPHLLLFEAESLLRSHDRQGAAHKLTLFGGLDQSPSIRQALAALRARIERGAGS